MDVPQEAVQLDIRLSPVFFMSVLILKMNPDLPPLTIANCADMGLFLLQNRMVGTTTSGSGSNLAA